MLFGFRCTLHIVKNKIETILFHGKLNNISKIPKLPAESIKFNPTHYIQCES